MDLLSIAPLHFVIVIFSTPSSAITLNDKNVPDTVGFVKEDNQRDTVSLLLSCFATLILCIYSAVHLNVPSRGESRIQTLTTELRWCIIGLFAPELILYTAWRQLASAWQLQSVVEASRTDRSTESNSKMKSQERSYRDDEFTVAHGFYGTMGGLAIDLHRSNERHRVLFGGAKRLTFTAKGVALLAQCNHLPDIPQEDIRDKSKADGLAKLLVCIQAGWMIVQVITRTVTGLPTSLLEVHTVAHVVCALLMYLVWWHKPRQITAPTLIHVEEIIPLTIYMYLASRMSGKQPKGKLAMFRKSTPHLESLRYIESHNDENRKQNSSSSTHCLERSTTAVPGYFARPGTSDSREREPSSPLPEDEIISEQSRLAAEAVSMYPALRSRFNICQDTSINAEGQSYLIPYVDELVQDHSIDWPNEGLLRRTQSLVMGMVLWGASMAYGAIHVAAWNYFFPSRTEELFWHLSSVWVTFCAAIWLLTNFLALAFPGIDKVWVLYNERRLGWFGTAVIMVLCALCGASYIVSRAYLVIEAFVSIRKVPTGVYQTPAWTAVFPHL